MKRHIYCFDNFNKFGLMSLTFFGEKQNFERNGKNKCFFATFSLWRPVALAFLPKSFYVWHLGFAVVG